MKASIDEHLQVIEALRSQLPLIERIAGAIVETIRGGGRLYVFGNGGSAADAQHIAGELLGRFKLNRRAIAAMALTTDSSILTAVANDLGAEEVFARQVEGLVTAKDIVWVLSVSGTSPNIIRAVAKVKQIGARLIGFTGQTGGELAPACDYCLRAAHQSADRVQEAHELAYHMICERVEQELS